MKFLFFPFLVLWAFAGKGQYQPWKKIEPGIFQFRGLIPPLRNSFLIELGKEEYVLINTPFNTIDQAAMLNSLRTDFPQWKLKGIIILENDYSSASGAFLFTSALGKVPIYSTHSLQFSEEEKMEFLSKNPRNEEAGKSFIPLSDPISMNYSSGKLILKKFGEGSGKTSFAAIVQPSGTLFCSNNWVDQPFPISSNWSFSAMISDFNFLLSLNPSRIFSGGAELPFPKFRLWEIQQSWEQWQADYQVRKQSKMTFEEFQKSMNQRFRFYPWVPREEKYGEILWKNGLKSP